MHRMPSFLCPHGAIVTWAIVSTVSHLPKISQALLGTPRTQGHPHGHPGERLPTVGNPEGLGLAVELLPLSVLFGL